MGRDKDIPWSFFLDFSLLIIQVVQHLNQSYNYVVTKIPRLSEPLVIFVVQGTLTGTLILLPIKVVKFALPLTVSAATQSLSSDTGKLNSQLL